MRSFRIEGIVIKRKNFSESDRIITIFSKTRGKIKVKASGVRKITSRRSPHIELLNFCVFNLHQGKSMPVLTEVESLENFSVLKNDLKKIGIAYHFCELVDGLCAENQNHLDVFNLLSLNLKRLSKEDDYDNLLYNFEINLLTMLGFYNPDGSKFKVNTQGIIEDILERRLKTKQILPQLC